MFQFVLFVFLILGLYLFKGYSYIIKELPTDFELIILKTWVVVTIFVSMFVLAKYRSRRVPQSDCRRVVILFIEVVAVPTVVNILLSFWMEHVYIAETSQRPILYFLRTVLMVALFETPLYVLLALCLMDGSYESNPRAKYYPAFETVSINPSQDSEV